VGRALSLLHLVLPKDQPTNSKNTTCLFFVKGNKKKKKTQQNVRHILDRMNEAITFRIVRHLPPLNQ
jgi:hypothetical protein